MKKKDRDADLRWIHGVIVQAAWFVKASLEQNALSGNSPATPDSWISCSERMPDTKTAVLVAVEFDRKGDWRMKWATYIPGHPDANDGWIILVRRGNRHTGCRYQNRRSRMVNNAAS